jgi:hypothetical protein
MENQNYSSEEIDLLSFFKPLTRGLKKINISVDKYFYQLKRNILLFASIFIIISLGGYFSKYFIHRYYKISAVFVSYNLPANFCSEMLTDLQPLISSGLNMDLLKEQLHIDNNSAKSIKSISTYPLDSLLLLDKRDTTGAAFKITLELSDDNDILQIQNGLKSYLENNEFSLKRKEAKRRTLEAIRTDLLGRITDLDSLKFLLSKSVIPQSNGQGIILGQPVSPIQAYQVQQDYYKQEKEIEEKLTLLQNIEIVQPFLKINSPNYPNFQKYFLISMIIGLILALLLTPFFGKR